jgi:hypothetical protein
MLSRLQAEHMFQDIDDGIIHEVVLFIQTLALRFGSVKIGGHLINFVCAGAFVEELVGMPVYVDGERISSTRSRFFVLLSV